MIKNLISRLTMKRLDCLFVDKVNGKEVFRWKDKYGGTFMAQNRFGTRIDESKTV